MQAATAALQQSQQLQAGASGQGQSSATALQLVKVLQQQVGNLEARLTSQEKKRGELKKVCVQSLHTSCFSASDCLTSFHARTATIYAGCVCMNCCSGALSKGQQKSSVVGNKPRACSCRRWKGRNGFALPSNTGSKGVNSAFWTLSTVTAFQKLLQHCNLEGVNTQQGSV